MRKIVDVPIRMGGSYPVFLGDDAEAFLDAVWPSGGTQAAIIGDDTTIRLFAPAVEGALRSRGVRVFRLAFAPGEASKTRETKAAIEDAMLEKGMDRSACVVGVGGGIALDMAGFVAATFLRGIDVVYIATSLLAQVDASVGGKTGVNTAAGKNLIGAFHPPRAVLLPTSWLASLPDAEVRGGLSEAVKTAVVADASLFASIECMQPTLTPSGLSSVVERCVRIKAGVVGRDEREQGLRRILNFGHTVGHAVERASQYGIAHGQAVALGMMVEARVAERMVGLPSEDRRRIEQIVKRLRLAPRSVPAWCEVSGWLCADKKTDRGQVRCALPVRIGAMDPAEGQFARPVRAEILAEAWEQVLGQTHGSEGGES